MDGVKERACLPKSMPDSMLELRAKLDGRGIEWHDASDEREIAMWGFTPIGAGLDKQWRGYDRIYRTHWETKRHVYSAICGYSTYGRESDLLELMIDESEPIGWLNADSVLQAMDEIESVG